MDQSSKNITIAPPLDSHEIEQMMAVRVCAAEDAYSKPGGPDTLQVRNQYSLDSRTIAEGILSEKFSALCAKAGSCVVGMCVWSEIDSNNANIDYLYVTPGFQGQGVGELLLDTALQLIGDIRTVQLTTQSAQKLYERKGFVRTGQFVTDEITFEEIMIRTSLSA